MNTKAARIANYQAPVPAYNSLLGLYREDTRVGMLIRRQTSSLTRISSSSELDGAVKAKAISASVSATAEQVRCMTVLTYSGRSCPEHHATGRHDPA